MAIFLMLPGSPVPDWLILLTPLAALVIIIQCSQWLYRWFRHRFSHHSQLENGAPSDGDSEPFA